MIKMLQNLGLDQDREVESTPESVAQRSSAKKKIIMTTGVW